MLARRFGARRRFPPVRSVVRFRFGVIMPGPQDPRRGSGERDHRAFDPDRARSAIEDHDRARPSGTCSAVVGESSVNRFALGAAIGICAASINARAIGCAGIRRPTLGSPAVTISGTLGLLGNDDRQRAGPETLGEAFGIIGPFARQLAGHFDRGHMDDQRARSGRPLASKMRRTAASSRALAPSP